MDSYFDQLYCLVQNDDEIIALNKFCKQIHEFVICDVEYCKNDFFIDMLHVTYLNKHTNIKKRRWVFTTHSLEWSKKFFYLLEKHNNKDYFLDYMKNNKGVHSQNKQKQPNCQFKIFSNGLLENQTKNDISLIEAIVKRCSVKKCC